MEIEGAEINVGRSFLYVDVGNLSILHISKAKLLPYSGTIFLNELRNIKETFIKIMSFPTKLINYTEIKHFINKTERHNIDNTLNQ